MLPGHTKSSVDYKNIVILFSVWGTSRTGKSKPYQSNGALLGQVKVSHISLTEHF